MNKIFECFSTSDLKNFRQIIKYTEISVLKRMRNAIQLQLSNTIDNNLKFSKIEKDFSNMKNSPKDMILWILNENWSELYDSYEDESNNYYVYLHKNPKKTVHFLDLKIENEGGENFTLPYAFYIGMGKNNRIYDTKRSRIHSKRLKLFFDLGFVKEEMMIFFKKNLSERQARILEAKLILIYGIISYTDNNMSKKKDYVHFISKKKKMLLNQQYEPFPKMYNLIN